MTDNGGMKGLRTGILIQARSNSTRFPGKIYSGLPIDGEPSIIERIYHRLSGVHGARVVCVLIPEEDRRLKEFLDDRGILNMAGSSEDVRSRYREAARFFGLDIIVRATGDNPCVDPTVAADTIRNIQRSHFDLLSFSNLPLGVAVEAFTARALLDETVVNRPEYEEHVSLHIKHNPSYFKVKHLEHPSMYRIAEKGSALPRLTVDTPEDLEVVRNVFGKLGAEFDISDVMDLFSREPALFEANRMIRQITFSSSEDQSQS